MSTAKFNTWQNPDGTENYKCRAWVNFNGTGTVAIRAAGNVTSITDNAAGDYTVNFTTAMPDANYSVTGLAGVFGVQNAAITQIGNNTTSISIRTRLSYADTAYDSSLVQIAVFR